MECGERRRTLALQLCNKNILLNTDRDHRERERDLHRGPMMEESFFFGGHPREGCVAVYEWSN